MNTKEFQAAFAIADNPDNELHNEDIDIFHGIALPGFQPVVATVRQVASMLRWQALFIATKPGETKWDTQELTELKRLFKTRITVLQ